MERINWIALTALALLTGFALVGSGFAIVIDDPLARAVGSAAVLALIGKFMPWRGAGNAMTALAQLSVCWMATVPLNFMGAAVAMPLQDAALASADRMMGLDWPAMYAFCVSRPALMQWAALLYGAIGLFGTAVPLVLGFADSPRLQRFVGAVIITVVVIGVVNVFVPAMGTYWHFGLDAHAEGLTAQGYLDQLSMLPQTRDGSLHALRMAELQGIITFPSFHAASGVLAVWALWSVRYLRWIVLAVGGGMVLATPLCGGHYFSDVVVGSLIAAAAIYIVNTVERRCA